MGSQVTRAIYRNSREAPYRGNQQAAKSFIKGLSFVMSLLAVGCVGFIQGQITLLNFHTYVLLIWLLSLAVNLTTSTFVLFVSFVAFAVGGLFFSTLSTLFQTIKIAMILAVGSNFYNSFDNKWIVVVFVWCAEKVVFLSIVLNRHLKELRLSKGDTRDGHVLGMRIFLCIFCFACIFLVIIGYRHIRRFIIKPIRINQYLNLVFLQFKNYDIFFLTLLLWLLKSTEHLLPYSGLSWIGLILYIIIAYFGLNREEILLLSAFPIVLWNIVPPEVTYLLLVVLNLEFMERMMRNCQQRGNIRLALILLIDKMAQCTKSYYQSTIYQHINMVWLAVLLLGISFYTVKMITRRKIYESLPQ